MRVLLSSALGMALCLPNFALADGAGGKDLNGKNLNALFQKLDKNGDKQLSIDEFAPLGKWMNQPAGQKLKAPAEPLSKKEQLSKSELKQKMFDLAQAKQKDGKSSEAKTKGDDAKKAEPQKKGKPDAGIAKIKQAPDQNKPKAKPDAPKVKGQPDQGKPKGAESKQKVEEPNKKGPPDQGKGKVKPDQEKNKEEAKPKSKKGE
jgi:hypothetical protein